ncbi:hypothetical protein BD413DRAFT_599302, partial [Trametes elegans]
MSMTVFLDFAEKCPPRDCSLVDIFCVELHVPLSSGRVEPELPPMVPSVHLGDSSQHFRYRFRVDNEAGCTECCIP